MKINKQDSTFLQVFLSWKVLMQGGQWKEQYCCIVSGAPKVSGKKSFSSEMRVANDKLKSAIKGKLIQILKSPYMLGSYKNNSLKVLLS